MVNRHLRACSIALISAVALSLVQAPDAHALTSNYSVIGSNSGGYNLRFGALIYTLRWLPQERPARLDDLLARR